MAAAKSAIGNLLDEENARPTVQLQTRRECKPPSDALVRDARAFAAADARNHDAADALDRFFQLADAEARAELLAVGLRAFDRLRQEVAKLKAAGLPAPADDELFRQRSKLLSDAEQAEAGIKLLNIDLKARLGLPTKGPDRLWPTGNFTIVATPTDAGAAVQAALESRPDLKGLRALYLGLSPETLPAVRDQLRGTNGLLGGTAPPLPTPRLFRMLSPHRGDAAAVAAQTELETRRKQLYELISEREKQAAAEVRAAAVLLDSLARRVALAHGRVDNWQAKIADLRAKGGKPAEILQAEMEWYKARAELVTEVMNWHRARVKLALAGGKLD